VAKQERSRPTRCRTHKSAPGHFPEKPPGFSKSRVYPPVAQLLLRRKQPGRPLHSHAGVQRDIVKGHTNNKNSVGSPSGRAAVLLVFDQTPNLQKSLLNPFRARFCARYPSYTTRISPTSNMKAYQAV